MAANGACTNLTSSRGTPSRISRYTSESMMIPVSDGTAMVFDFSCATAVIDGSRVIQTALGRST